MEIIFRVDGTIELRLLKLIIHAMLQSCIQIFNMITNQSLLEPILLLYNRVMYIKF